jgi:hypothetical protein
VEVHKSIECRNAQIIFCVILNDSNYEKEITSDPMHLCFTAAGLHLFAGGLPSL